MTLLTDTFTRADTTSGLVAAETGEPYSPVESFRLTAGYEGNAPGGALTQVSSVEPLGISTNKGYSPETTSFGGGTDTARWRAEVADLGTPDVGFTWETSLNTGWGGEGSGIIFRYEDANNFSLAYLIQDVGAGLGVVQLYLVECVAGSYSVLGGSPTAGNVTGVYKVTFTAIGSVFMSVLTNPSSSTYRMDKTLSRLGGTLHGPAIRNFDAAAPLLDNLNVHYTSADCPGAVMPLQIGQRAGAQLAPARYT